LWPDLLAQVYRFLGYERAVDEVISDTRRNADGGTLGVYLGISALRNGFRPTIYTYNLRIFDPTWRRLSPPEISGKLRERRRFVRSRRLKRAIAAYVEYLGMGCRVPVFRARCGFLVGLLQTGHPILTGFERNVPLWVRSRTQRGVRRRFAASPRGISSSCAGYYPRSDRFVVRDPSSNIPFSRNGKYTVEARRLIAAILLGDVTYDANLLVL
jgi:hypothetical protein